MPVMAHLSLALLGHYRAALDDRPVGGFESNKVRALLAYLAVEGDCPHSREMLAGLLWPEYPERAALANLRFALSNLRKALGDRDARPSFLLISNDALQFNPAADFDLDVRRFAESAAAGDIERVRQAVSLYRGPFLEGFAIGDSAAFEEWLVLKREQLGRQMIRALRRLADHHEARGEYELAQQYGWRLVEMEPWQEEGHRQLMRLLVLGGQRSAALVQYETCRRLLADELGVEPAAETTALYQSIRDGRLPAAPIRAAPPAFLDPAVQPAEDDRPLFVGRDPELARLDQYLGNALAGHGRVAFIIGETGSGKTMLMQEFSRRALAAQPELIAVGGMCNAHTGSGDPYLPFLQLLQSLTGDVEAKWAAGAITPELARRLWALLPEAVSALMDDGAELIDRFAPGDALLARAQLGAPAQAARLHELLERRATSGDAGNVQQADLIEQYARVLLALARRRPLALLVDDLQWADAGSVNLLFHLGRRLAGGRILLVGAYRASDVSLGRGGDRHPLEPVLNELQRDFGEMRLDLAQADGRRFVEALLDSEPNCLGDSFRETLFRHTGGHPLFTVELLRDLQARGDLVKDDLGRWTVGGTIAWESLPPRAEATIAERIDRLPEALQETLMVASVEGEEFTLEAVSRVQAVDEQEITRWLSGPLSRQHRLVSAIGVQRLGEGHIARYRFRHILFQKFLYGRLDEVERMQLHEGMGNALEALYGERAPEIAVQLARHFECAGRPVKAVTYLLLAGRRAVQLSAHAEAIAHCRKALDLLKAMPDSPARAQQELAVQMSLGVSLAATRGYADPEMGTAYGRAWELCRQLGPTPELFPVLTGLGGYYSLRADYRTSREVYGEILEVAERSGDPTLLAIGHWGIGYLLVVMGEPAAGRAHLEQAIALYDREQHRSLAAAYYQDPGVSCLTWLSWALHALGYPDQALQRSREALALAEELSHPFTQAFALGLAAVFRFFRQEAAETARLAEAAIDVSAQKGFPFWQAAGVIMRGWASVRQGDGEAGLAAIRDGIGFVRMSGASQPLPTWLMVYADACATQGLIGQALELATEAQTAIAEWGGAFDEAEAVRCRGELHLLTGDGQAAAEACFLQASAIARRQQTRLWELRALLSLCRLRQGQGRGDEARRRLADVYNWFTEGFDTPDLREAAGFFEEAMLQPAEVSGSPAS